MNSERFHQYIASIRDKREQRQNSLLANIQQESQLYNSQFQKYNSNFGENTSATNSVAI